MASPWSTYFLPRDLHPAAWWVWALGLSIAASRTTNPLLLLTAIAVASAVVVARRSEAPWAMSFRMYLILGTWIVVMRVVFRVVFGGGEGATIILHLPEIPLPAWAAGIRLFGDVSAESVLAGLYDGLRLATMVVCLGAANALANPKRLLASMPSALYEVGTAVIVALSVFPQLAESAVRIRRARRLRGDGAGRFHLLRSIIIPVLEDALDRSLQLAASMDSRGYGRTGSASRQAQWATGTLMVVGLGGLCVGVYNLLDGTANRPLVVVILLVSTAVSLAGFGVAGRRVQRVRYRPDRWHAPEVVVALSGVAVAVVLFLSSELDPASLDPSLVTVAWPTVAWLPLVGVLLGLVPAVLTPLPEPPYASFDDEVPAVPVDLEVTA